MLNGIGGRTVAEAKARISGPEFDAWCEFYRQNPFDDMHRYHRPAAMVASAWGGKYQERIEFLSPAPVMQDNAPQPANAGRYSAADLATINAFAKMSGR